MSTSKQVNRLIEQQKEVVLLQLTRREAYLLAQVVLDGPRTMHEACPEARRTIYELGHALYDIGLPF